MYVDLVNIQKQLNLELNAEIALSGGAVCSPHLFKQMKAILKLKRVKVRELSFVSKECCNHK